MELSSRFLHRLHLAYCSEAYGSRLSSEVPHPQLIYVGTLSPETRHSFHTAWDTERLITTHNIRDKADKRFKVPTNVISESDLQENIPHKTIESARQLIANIFDEIADQVEPILGYCIEIINIRFFKLIRSPGSESSAYNSLHTDGFPPGIYKILIYIDGANLFLGTTQIFFGTTIDSPSTTVSCNPCQFILFDSNNLFHRAIPPQLQGDGRLTIELTIGPALRRSNQFMDPGFYAFYPLVPLMLHELK
jgi:hypothetical protein